MDLSMGVDPSLTGTGIIVLNANEIVEKMIIKTRPKNTIEERFGQIINPVLTIFDHYKPLSLCLEGLSFGSKGNAFAQLSGLHFVLIYNIWEHFRHLIKTTVVPPQTLKKFVTGKGNVKKQVMLLETYKKWGESFTDDNLCDAYCLARYGLALLKGAIKQ
jgi:crossover junction endodeoxyribonuclease RuvC